MDEIAVVNGWLTAKILAATDIANGQFEETASIAKS
jgi:hypothetical protein